MTKIKVAIIYYSSTGSNYQLSKWAAEAAEQAGAEVKIAKVKELAPAAAIDSNPLWKKHVDDTANVAEASLDHLEWADVYIFSAPTRYGNLPSQMKQFLDSAGGLWVNGKMVNKVVTAMSSAQNPHGGQEATILSFYTTMYHWGCIVVAPGYTDTAVYAAGGNPYGTSVSVSPEGKMEPDVKDAVQHQAKRAVTIARWVKDGSSAKEKEEYEIVHH
jgi:NAD(P)H dehydrogenase (quinone)